jgi:hypothetical protein
MTPPFGRSMPGFQSIVYLLKELKSREGREVESPELRVKSQESRVEIQESRGKSQESRVESKASRAED